MRDFRCWWQNHYVGDFFCYVGDLFSALNRSPTSQIGHQHPKVVTNTFRLLHPSPTSMWPKTDSTEVTENVDPVRLHVVRFIFLYKVWSDRIISLLFRFHLWQMNLYFEIFDERDETTSCLLFRVYKRWPTPFKITPTIWSFWSQNVRVHSYHVRLYSY